MQNAVGQDGVERIGCRARPITRDIADQRPSLEQVLPDLPPIEVPVWLVTHRELRTSRKIRLVFDLIAGHFEEGYKETISCTLS